MSEGWAGTSIHEDTIELVDDVKPEWMARSAFIDGCVWMFYAHLSHGQTRLTPIEKSAIYRLKKSGANKELIAHAFGISKETVVNVQAKPGEGDKRSYHRRETES